MVKTATKRAIQIAVKNLGSRASVADRFKITRQAMDQWERVPAKHVLALESLSGVSRYDLRPDIYGKPPQEGASDSRPTDGVPRHGLAA